MRPEMSSTDALLARPAELVALARSLEQVADRIAAGDVAEITPCEIAATGDGLGEVAAAAARLVAAVQRSHALEGAVHELFEALSSHLRIDYLGYEALYRVIEHTQAQAGAIVLVGEGPLDVVASVEFDLPAGVLTAAMAAAAEAFGPTQRTLEDGRPLVAVPFMGDAGLLGAVLLLGVELDSEIRRLLALLARALGFAVSNALTHAASERRAATDPLTGCSNRRAGLALLEQAMRVAARGGPPVGLLMLDLDHFKRINDGYGHQTGDEVLEAAGAVLGSSFRDEDIVMRYGGEEFLVALVGVELPELTAIAERVIRTIRSLDVSDGNGGTVPLTTSVGAAAWKAADNMQTLVARADRALYAAKAAGRDRVVVA
jgi:two-component system, cell cycle response regulator